MRRASLYRGLMSTALASTPLLTFEEYLAFEVTSAVRHEYHQGVLVMMGTGCSRPHEVVVGNTFAAIRRHLGDGAPCQVYLSGLGVRVEAADASYYPDLHVTGDPRDHEAERVSVYPSVIIEVLSNSTRDYDFGTKLADFKLISSLQEYVLIDSEAQGATVHRRLGTKRWENVDLSPGDTLEFRTLRFSMSFADIYLNSRVPFPRPRPRLVPDPE